MDKIKRETFNRIKSEVFERDKHICQYCGKKIEPEEMMLEHIIPWSHGGSFDADNLITACKYCNCLKANKTLKDHLLDAIKSNTEYFHTFTNSMDNITVLLKNSTFESSVKQVFYRLLYSNIIASMETYLSDAFINTVMRDKVLIRRLVESDPEFKKRKITFSEIFTCIDELENTIKEYLLDIIYHNIWIIKNMYKCVLNIDFPEDMQKVNSAVMIRHDIVHRNGKSKKTGEIHDFTKEEVLECIADINKFINYIDNQLKILDSTTLGEVIKRSYLDTHE